MYPQKTLFIWIILDAPGGLGVLRFTKGIVSSEEPISEVLFMWEGCEFVEFLENSTNHEWGRTRRQAQQVSSSSNEWKLFKIGETIFGGPVHWAGVNLSYVWKILKVTYGEGREENAQQTNRSRFKIEVNQYRGPVHGGGGGEFVDLLENSIDNLCGRTRRRRIASFIGRDQANVITVSSIIKCSVEHLIVSNVSISIIKCWFITL